MRHGQAAQPPVKQPQLGRRAAAVEAFQNDEVFQYSYRGVHGAERIMKTRTLVMTVMRPALAIAMLCMPAASWGQELPEQLIVVTGRDRSVPVFPRPSYQPDVLIPMPETGRVRLDFWEPVPAPQGELNGISREEEFPLPAEL
jgi:hypothetical protein